MSRHGDPEDYWDARADALALDHESDRRGTRAERQLEDRVHGEHTPDRRREARR